MPINLQRQHVFDAIVWEAALCFSWLNCILIGDHSWPTNRPYGFAAAVLGGATVALLLCHIVPAFFARDWCNRQYDNPQRGPLRYIGWILKAWFSIGAAASDIRLAQAVGESLLSVFGQVFWKRLDEKFLVALGAAAALLIGSLVLTAKLKWQTVIGGILGLAGLAFIVFSAILQSRGLSTYNPRLATEAGLGDNYAVFTAILFATAPASIFALRVGKSGIARSAITWSGILGIWLPVVSSTTLVGLAKVGGVRLYWKHHVPIHAGFAFTWLFQAVGGAEFGLVLMIMMFVPLVVSMSWIKELLAPGRWSRKSLFALAIVGITGLSLTFSDESLFQIYYAPWCWSILCASFAYVWRPAPLRLRHGRNAYDNAEQR